MPTLTADAQQHLDQYLHGVRLSLRGTGLEAAEVEADVREHIASALEGEAVPVARPVLERVLERLGPPMAWVPDEELPGWRRVVRRLAKGPEDWRLSYLCFGLFALGLVTAPFGGMLFGIAAYFVGRAACAVAGDQGAALGARKWLIYPPLVFLSLSIALLIVTGPLPPLAVWGIEGNGFVNAFGREEALSASGRLWVYMSAMAAATGLWWLLVAAFGASRVNGLRSLLLPLANGLQRRHLVWLGGLGALLVAVGVGVLVSVR
jgi:hypothetical protein